MSQVLINQYLAQLDVQTATVTGIAKGTTVATLGLDGTTLLGGSQVFVRINSGTYVGVIAEVVNGQSVIHACTIDFQDFGAQGLIMRSRWATRFSRACATAWQTTMNRATRCATLKRRRSQ